MTDLSQDKKEVIIDLLEINMKKLYEESEWGWNAKKGRGTHIKLILSTKKLFLLFPCALEVDHYGTLIYQALGWGPHIERKLP